MTRSEIRSNVWLFAASSATGLYHGFWILTMAGLLWDGFMVPEQTVHGLGTNFLVRLGLVWLSGHLAAFCVGRSKAAFEAHCVEEEGMPWCQGCQGYHYPTAKCYRKGGA